MTVREIQARFFSLHLFYLTLRISVGVEHCNHNLWWGHKFYSRPSPTAPLTRSVRFCSSRHHLQVVHEQIFEEQIVAKKKKNLDFWIKVIQVFLCKSQITYNVWLNVIWMQLPMQTNHQNQLQVLSVQDLLANGHSVCYAFVSFSVTSRNN